MSALSAMLAYAGELSGSRALVPVLLQVLILFLAVWIDPYILKKQRRIMTLIAVLVLSIVVENIIAAYLETDVIAPFARTVEGIYGYSVRPVVILLFFYILEPEKSRRPFWWLVGLNAAVYLTALFSPVAFYISEDNHFGRGPLGYSAFAVSAVLLLYLLYLSYREWNRVRRAEALIPLVNALLVILAVLMDSVIVPARNGLTYLTFAMVSCSLLYYIWLHLKFVRDHEEALKLAQRMQIMLSQIQPHFLYNTLTVIQDLCRTDPAQAEAATVRFAKYLRGNMDSLRADTPVPFSRELEHTREYLTLEKMRFEDRLTVRYDIQCTSFSLPTLTLQPIAENAVRHGVRQNPEGRGEVAVSAREYPDRYEVTVTDDGPGFDPEAPQKDDGRSHVGIENVRERLAQMCGGALRIDSEPGKGTRVTILLPKARE